MKNQEQDLKPEQGIDSLPPNPSQSVLTLANGLQIPAIKEELELLKIYSLEVETLIKDIRGELAFLKKLVLPNRELFDTPAADQILHTFSYYTSYEITINPTLNFLNASHADSVRWLRLICAELPAVTGAVLSPDFNMDANWNQIMSLGKDTAVSNDIAVSGEIEAFHYEG